MHRQSPDWKTDSPEEAEKWKKIIVPYHKFLNGILTINKETYENAKKESYGESCRRTFQIFNRHFSDAYPRQFKYLKETEYGTSFGVMNSLDRQRWQAVAYSRNPDECPVRLGQAMDFPSQKSAEAYALQLCGTKRCKAFSVLNMCISLAYDSEGKYGIGTGETLKEAKKNAKSDCLLKSSGCIYSESSCSIENSLGE